MDEYESLIANIQQKLHDQMEHTPASSTPRIQADEISLQDTATPLRSCFSRLLVSMDEVVPLQYPRPYVHSAFTDGSVENKQAGCGVYLEDGCSRQRFGFAARIIPTETSSSDTRCPRPPITPLEAELHAILAAAQMLHTREAACHVYIYTDCEEALMLLEICKSTPHALFFHQHFTLVQFILLHVQILLSASSSTFVHLHKVRAHKGIFGNELADSLAKLGRRLDLGSPCHLVQYVLPLPFATNQSENYNLDENQQLCCKLAALQLNKTPATTQSSHFD